MLYWVRGEKLLAVVHPIYFLRILQKLSNIWHPSRQNSTTEVCFFCKKKIIHENIWANYFSPLTFSWSVSMKITGESLYYSSMIIFFYIHLFGIYSTRLKYILSCQTTFSRAYSPEEILKICQHHRLHLKDVHCPWKFENLRNKEMGKCDSLWFPFFWFSNTKLNCNRSTGILIERAKNVFLF